MDWLAADWDTALSSAAREKLRSRTHVAVQPQALELHGSESYHQFY
jgi:hypothetical protein